MTFGCAYQFDGGGCTTALPGAGGFSVLLGGAMRSGFSTTPTFRLLPRARTLSPPPVEIEVR